MQVQELEKLALTYNLGTITKIINIIQVFFLK
jgi:hypothetical protein